MNQKQQGDVCLENVASFPVGADRVKERPLAVGEVTGHTHRIENPELCEFYEIGGILFVKVKDNVLLKHEEHGPITLEPGIWKVGIERFVQKCGAKIIDKVGNYCLLEIMIPSYAPMRYLKMKNPSIGVWHVEGVPNDCENVAQCINWRAYGDKTKSWLPVELT